MFYLQLRTPPPPYSVPIIFSIITNIWAIPCYFVKCRLQSLKGLVICFSKGNVSQKTRWKIPLTIHQSTKQTPDGNYGNIFMTLLKWIKFLSQTRAYFLKSAIWFYRNNTWNHNTSMLILSLNGALCQDLSCFPISSFFIFFYFPRECEMNLNKFSRGDCSWQESGMFYSASWGDKRGSVIMIAIGHASILSLPRARNAILSPGARGSHVSHRSRARQLETPQFVSKQLRSREIRCALGSQRVTGQSWCTNCAWTVRSPFDFSMQPGARLMSLSLFVRTTY